MAYSYEYPKADITVDCVLFGFNPDNASLGVVMIRRGEEPFRGCWALPGGFIEFEKGETAYEAAKRELLEETGITIDYLEQLMTFDAPKRDPRGRVFAVAHWALVRSQDHPTTHGSDASEAKWMSVQEVLDLPDDQVAFDHKYILQTAVNRLQAKVRYTPLGFKLLPKKFTLGQLQKLYEAILLRKIDKRNFRKRVLMLDLFDERFAEITETGGRPAQLYRLDQRRLRRAEENGFDFEI